MNARVRILVAKPGLDGHDRGVKVIARALRDAGFEVVYTGLHQTPEQIVRAAIDEDADAIGVSSMSGAHMTQIPKIRSALVDAGAGDIDLFAGGIIPDEDIEKLKALGVSEIFGPGTSTEHVVSWVRDNIQPRTGDSIAESGPEHHNREEA